MKNKVITLICILAIMVTTAIVAFADLSEPQYVNSNPVKDDSKNLISQQIFDANGNTAPDDEELYPSTVLDRKVTVTNDTSDTPVYVRTVLAFEAGDLTLEEFHDTFYILLNQSTDGAGAQYWSWPANNDWTAITIEGTKYYMTTAVYTRELAAGETALPSLLQVGMVSSVTSDVAEQFDGEYKLLAVTQAVQASGWSNNDGSITAINGILNTAFGEITSTNHPWISTTNN